MRRFRPADALEIQDLKARYFRFVDGKQWTRLRELFTEDCRFEGLWAAAPTPDDFVANLARNFDGALRSVHRGFPPELRRTADDVVRGLWPMVDYLTWPPEEGRTYLGVAVPGQRGMLGCGYYEEEYRSTDAGWRISYLRLVRQRLDPIVGPAPEVDFPFLPPDPDWL